MSEQEDQPAAVAGAVASMRIMVDNTVRVTIDFEPKDREAVMRIMGMVGRPVAVAALRDGYAAVPNTPEPKSELGPLCLEALNLCLNPAFLAYIGHDGDRGFYWKPTNEAAKDFLLTTCGVKSRKELDTNEAAATAFRAMRAQFMRWVREKDGT